jgi:hypothetical protein
MQLLTTLFRMPTAQAFRRFMNRKPFCVIAAFMVLQCAPTHNVIGGSQHEGKDADSINNANPILTDPVKNTVRVNTAQPIINARCLPCHSSSSQMGGITLDSYESILAASPPLIVVGQPELSRLYLSVQTGRMPVFASKLSDSELKDLYEWILNGAVP